MIFNVGIIGLGMIGESMLGEFLNHPAFNVHTVWDLNETINEHISSRFPGVQTAKDAKAIIQDPHIDLIYIATPPLTHIDYAWQTVQAKKALLCEKPLAIDLASSRELVKEVEGRGIPTAMNFVYGAGDVVDAIEYQLSSGVLGTLQSVEIRYQFPSWPLPNQLSAASWISKRDQGGMIREMFSHFVYLIHRLFGVLEVDSTILYFPEPDANQGTETFVLSHLRTGAIPVWLMGGIGGIHAPRESEFTIHGTQASLRLGSSNNISISDSGSWHQLPVVRRFPSDAQARLGELAKLLAGEPSKLPNLRAGLQVQTVIEKMLNK